MTGVELDAVAAIAACWLFCIPAWKRWWLRILERLDDVLDIGDEPSDRPPNRGDWQ